MLWGFSYIPSISEISIFPQCMLAGDKITLTSVKPPLEMKTIFVSSGLSSPPLSFSLVQEECNGNTNIYLVYIYIQITFFFFPGKFLTSHMECWIVFSLKFQISFTSFDRWGQHAISCSCPIQVARKSYSSATPE